MTINVVCRRDAINRNRLAPLALVFTHDRRRKFVGLGISEALVHWDFDKQQPTADCPDRAEIQFQITSKIREYERKIKKLEVLEIPVTFDTLFEQNGKRINCTVGEYFKQIIERLEKVEKYSSASKHKVTLVLVSQFRSVNMRFDELDLTYLREFEIFLSQKGNVNNSCNYAAFQYCRLYLIEILHQTTTHCKCIQFTLCCILSKFYIKPQHPSKVFARYQSCILSKFYIKPQLGWRTCFLWCCCILSKFYIKPQPPSSRALLRFRCILSKFYIKPQQVIAPSIREVSCILSKFYIKPQQPPRPLSVDCGLYLIEILHQTTTDGFVEFLGEPLYLIEILHQTTTMDQEIQRINQLYLIEILHQTTTRGLESREFPGVVSYRNSTSNHNKNVILLYDFGLYLIEILHQTTTGSEHVLLCPGLYLIEILHQTTTTFVRFRSDRRCILSKFYIKPQRWKAAV